ncbi:hypothetical protein BO94DRAFT_555533 [Aspergillus sclerotioniger CBS 115572]|uniref:Zn(2)-C6 fungal-type domain-containing protein n=1 Tax=Aspergillus sclerotioniger CBS 115572 TaxID=1450535 RepID=A0A317WVA8_9EURO|nr:hypothetical protein BO94DRAFT_555533 [Aspergillus sclerotioniger CBS 115572]PWY90354.1 hypothetical protein BO94DRAFT_555533 [Aspergillus sclerotioniger CBS 115572]
MGSEPESPSDSPRHRSKRIACRQCRQAKLRCEVSTGGAIPCSRCRRLGYDCKLDTAFQRVNRRERLEELEKEVQHLRSSVSTIPATQQPLPSLPTPSESYSAATSIVDPESSGAPLRFSFFQRYHPYVPLLDPAITADQYYARSALLFWVIILVASRRYTDEPGLFVTLTAPVKRLLWDTIANPPHTWHVVQSILLVCLWPFPTSSLSSDITSILVSTAQTIAVRMGLHRPEAIQDFSRTKRRLNVDEMAEVARTWATCYITAQIIATIDGQIWVTSDWMVDRLCDRDGTGMIPTSLKHQLLISRFSARVGQFMSGHPQGPTGLPRPGEVMSLLALLEREYTELASTLTSQISEENKILLNFIALQLYVFYLLEDTDSDTRKRGLLRAYTIALETITTMNHLETLTDTMPFGPISYFRALSIAAMFILKLSYSNLGPFLDLETGKRCFNSAIMLTRRISIEDNDLPGRTSKILTQLWSAQARTGQRDKGPGLRLKTRLAASLVHDSMWAWREQFGGQMSGVNTPLGGMRGPNNVQEPGMSVPNDGSGTEGLSLEDVVDAELLALLPFSLEGDDILAAQGGC